MTSSSIRRPVTVLLAMLLAVLAVAPAAAYHEGDNAEHPFANDPFERRWDRTDRPVEQGVIERTWMWGPAPYTGAIHEEYLESPDGERVVQYFEKSRMEINDPSTFDDDLWFVTNGLLVVEMVDGRIQVGDSAFEDAEPANVQIAGDPNAVDTPTYADINDHGLRSVPATIPGTVLTWTLDNGDIVQDQHFAQYGVTADYRVSVPNIDHTVASVFWEFMNSEGTVYVDGAYAEELLFIDPFYATGYPITEAYWATVPVAATAQDVLWQCFERRCLTYTPGNSEGFQVEAGNVGQHYYSWRYGDVAPPPPPPDETVMIYLVDVGAAEESNGNNDNGGFGCLDLLVPVEVEVAEQESLEGWIEAALLALFPYESDEFYNVFHNSDLLVADVQVINGVATVNLSGDLVIGGICDDPRVHEQVSATVEQFDGVDRVVLLINGANPFPPDTSELEGGVLATFNVAGEHFKLWVTNEQTIADLLEMEADPDINKHPNGPIHYGTGTGNHNAPWSWHLDPTETIMAEVSIEVCDGRPSYVEGEVDEFVGNVGAYCPWGAELVEVLDLRNGNGD